MSRLFFDCFFIIEDLNDISPKIPQLRYNEGMHHDSTATNTNLQTQKTKTTFPIKMMFWIDSNWEGVWVEELNRGKSEGCSIFHLHKEIKPLKPCTLHRHKSSSIQGSMKVQFFTHPQRCTNMPDFRFMSACPLKFFQSLEPFHLGLWNYNEVHCDVSGDAIPNFLLTVINRSVTNVPMGLEMEKAPSKEYHNLVKDTTHMLIEVLNKLFPDDPCEFKTLRTYGRNAWMTTFFFDLHKLYETKEEGTNLPPVLALYALSNALILHDKTPQEFYSLLTQEEVDVTVLLPLVRDIIMCFTICQREGTYRDDLSLGSMVEDQPFSFAFREGDNVFDEDDCEGHDQQGCVHMKGLFCMIAKNLKEEATKRLILQHLTSYTNKQSSCLSLSDSNMNLLLSICECLGDMFTEKVLDTVMCVGEANFASFKQVVEKKHDDTSEKKKLDGHSFGLMLYKRDNEIKGSMILETTGWSSKVFGPHAPNTKLIEIMKAIVQHSMRQKSKENKMIVKTVLTEESEDRLYVRVIAGDNCLFFTSKGGKLSYGASPSDIFRHTMVYNGQSKEKVAVSDTAVLMVTPEQFLVSLHDENSPWGKHENAPQMLRAYREILSMYPSFHKCLMPPQITEENFMQRIERFWGKITDKDLLSVHTTDSKSGTNTLTFSCRVDPVSREYFSDETRDFVARLSEKALVKHHDFMQSRVFIATPYISTTGMFRVD
jgi:hypothetical protein